MKIFYRIVISQTWQFLVAGAARVPERAGPQARGQHYEGQRPPAEGGQEQDYVHEELH
jgi:hypothetical protein